MSGGDRTADVAVVLGPAFNLVVRELLEGRDACVVRPGRYAMARGDIDEVTWVAATALGSALPV